MNLSAKELAELLRDCLRLHEASYKTETNQYIGKYTRSWGECAREVCGETNQEWVGIVEFIPASGYCDPWDWVEKQGIKL